LPFDAWLPSAISAFIVFTAAEMMVFGFSRRQAMPMLMRFFAAERCALFS
jgi:hypothetical protein